MGSSKLKRVIQTFIHSHLLRISHTFTKAKTLVFKAVKNIHIIHFIDFSMKKNKNKNKNKIFLGSFRLHNSSHIRLEGRNFSDVSSLNSTLFSTDSFDDDDIIMADDEEDATRLSGYLDWLEGMSGSSRKDFGNEIDRLADMFIAEAHMKFKVEKDESYRKFQEMMARSV